ncbi:MAG TPA: LPS export ABC transporter periplasmic protein LptC [Geobacteraceae bacterium]
MLKPNKIRQFLALAVILAGGGLVAVIAVKLYWGKRPAVVAKFSPTADISLQKLHYTETKKGKKQWDLTADKADYVREKEVTRLTGVRLVVAGTASTGDITLTAERADYHNKSGDVELTGNVRAKSVSGMEFTSNSAAYVAARSMIVTPDHVRFSDGMLSVEGVGMELAIDSRTVRVLHEVTANVTPGKRNK